MEGGGEVWSLLITWDTVAHFAENPDLLDDFLKESGVVNPLDRANLRPAMCDIEFMEFMHSDALLERRKTTAQE